ncbi:hypothetical protein SAMN05216236_14027 [Sedimentitalea nanhaiensis]|uniref:Uncharacterized protein n=1 Tax=Sedimentitalea nanhaiensis TaxID=999627 RepID=A0A1I7E0Z4_9RHOB|nr:hypothetical protein SAMN05216236_14027 [Sedimentitalea nanhaiensis]
MVLSPGFAPITPKGRSHGARPGIATIGQIEPFRAMWQDDTRGNVGGEKLNQWLERGWKISSLRFLRHESAPKVITVHKAMKVRATGSTKQATTKGAVLFLLGFGGAEMYIQGTRKSGPVWRRWFARTRPPSLPAPITCCPAGHAYADGRYRASVADHGCDRAQIPEPVRDARDCATHFPPERHVRKSVIHARWHRSKRSRR